MAVPPDRNRIPENSRESRTSRGTGLKIPRHSIIDSSASNVPSTMIHWSIWSLSVFLVDYGRSPMRTVLGNYHTGPDGTKMAPE